MHVFPWGQLEMEVNVFECETNLTATSGWRNVSVTRRRHTSATLLHFPSVTTTCTGTESVKHQTAVFSSCQWQVAVTQVQLQDKPCCYSRFHCLPPPPPHKPPHRSRCTNTSVNREQAVNHVQVQWYRRFKSDTENRWITGVIQERQQHFQPLETIRIHQTSVNFCRTSKNCI